MSNLFIAEQLAVLNQSLRGKRVKIEINNFQNKTLESIEGDCIDGTINLEASSMYRRSCNLDILVDDYYSSIISDKYIIDRGELIWLDKYIKIYVGIDKELTGETIWYDKGCFLIDNPKDSFGMDSNILSISGSDLMLRWSKDRSGQLANLETVISAYYTEDGVEYKQTLRNAFIGIINRYTDIKQYFIATIPINNKYLSEDIKFDSGITVDQMFEKLLSYLPGWELFFDEGGVLNIQPIPSGENDVIFPLDSNNTNVEEIQVDFGNVKNHIIVYGRTFDINPKFYVENSTEEPNNVYIVNDELHLVMPQFNPGEGYLIDNSLIEFLWLENQYNPILHYLSIHYTDSGGQTQVFTAPLYNFENNDINYPNQLNANTFQPGSLNVLRYRLDNVVTPYWDYLANEQAQAFVVQDNKNSPYYINQELIGENYYGGYSVSTNGLSYQLTLNNSTRINALKKGVQISFVANIINKTNPQVVLIDGFDSHTIATIPIGEWNTTSQQFEFNEAQFGGNYSVWLLELDYYNNAGVLLPYFKFKGRLPTLTYFLSGGEYENIYSNNLALQRAKYELYLHSNLNDSVTITTIPVYYLDVNKKIKYTNNKTGLDGYFLTKSISIPLAADGQYMTINAIKIYDSEV